MIPPRLYYVSYTFKYGDKRRNRRVSRLFQTLKAANNWRPTAAYVHAGVYHRCVYDLQATT